MSEEINVPLLDLRAQYDTIRDEIEPILRDVVESQWFVMGPKVADFEQAVAEYCGAEHAVGCASGSDSLLLALMASDIGPGDEVICPSYTFFATAGSIWRLGAKPIFCDIDPTTYNCTVETVTDAIGRCKNLKAIMPVHLFGQAVDLDGLGIGLRKQVPLIEDAAQGIGCRDATGARVGSRGMFGCFSFFPSKNLGGFGDRGDDHDERFGRRRSNASTSESWNGTQVLSRRSGSEFETRRASGRDTSCEASTPRQLERRSTIQRRQLRLDVRCSRGGAIRHELRRD